MPTYVKMANRMMETLSNGRSENEILIYAPMETYWKYVEHDLDTKTGFWEKGPWIKDEKAKFIDNQYQLVIRIKKIKNEPKKEIGFVFCMIIKIK